MKIPSRQQLGISRSMPAELIALERFMVVSINDVEYMCVTATSEYAILKNRFGEKLNLAGTHTKPSRIIRTYTEETYEDFFTRTGRVRNEQQNQSPEQKENNSMAKKNTGIGGASEFVRNLWNQGVSKTEIRKKLLEKFPKFANDEAGIESRLRTAERLAKSAKEREKVGSKAKAAKPTKAPAKAAGKKAAPKAGAKKGTPPPRPTAPPPRPEVKAEADATTGEGD